MYVCCLEVEEVEEGRVVDGERGPRRGDARGRGGMAVRERGVREDAEAQVGRRSGEDAGWLGRGPELGLARCARRGGSRRAGVLCRHAGCRGVLSRGRRCEFEIRSLIRTRAAWQRRMLIGVAGPRGCSTREGRHSGGRSLVGSREGVVGGRGFSRVQHVRSPTKCCSRRSS